MNIFVSVANLCKDPEPITLGKSECQKLRLADNTFGKKSSTRYFDMIVSGNDAEVASKLRTGDQIVAVGTLQLEEYKSKKGKTKGQTVRSDNMPFGKILQVVKSPTFFGGGEDSEAPEQELDDSEPDLALDDLSDAGDDDLDV